MRCRISYLCRIRPGIPRFNDEERDYFFSLDTMEKHAHDQPKSNTIKCLFSLQLAYFKAKRNFFSFDKAVMQDDLSYLKKEYPDVTAAEIFSISSSTKNRQHQTIMKIHGYRSLNKTDKNNLEAKADYCSSISVKPSFVCRELLRYLVEQRIVIPSYPAMQDLIGRTLQKERKRLDAYLNKAPYGRTFRQPSPDHAQNQIMIVVDSIL